MASINQLARKIGNVSVSPIGYGAMGVGQSYAYGPIDSDEERFKVRNEVGPLIFMLIAPRCSTPHTSKGVHTGIPLMYMVTLKTLSGNGPSVLSFTCRFRQLNVDLSGSNALASGMKYF
jgi:hypothetical protein